MVQTLGYLLRQAVIVRQKSRICLFPAHQVYQNGGSANQVNVHVPFDPSAQMDNLSPWTLRFCSGNVEEEFRSVKQGLPAVQAVQAAVDDPGYLGDAVLVGQLVQASIGPEPAGDVHGDGGI